MALRREAVTLMTRVEPSLVLVIETDVPALSGVNGPEGSVMGYSLKNREAKSAALLSDSLDTRIKSSRETWRVVVNTSRDCHTKTVRKTNTMTTANTTMRTDPL